MMKKYGNAAIAVMNIRAQALPKNAPYAIIPKDILK